MVYSISSTLYHFFLSCILIFPKGMQNAMIKFIRFTKLPHSKFYQDLKYNGRIKVKMDKKSFYLYSTGGTIENEIFWKGLDNSLEPETIWAWKILSKQAKVVVDIGANTGIYSLITKAINPACKVYGFEPSKKTFLDFEKNIACNNYTIQAYNIALSNKNGESIFYDVFDEHQTSASLSVKMLKENTGFKGEINEYVVKTTTLDNFVSEAKLPSVDLIKLDVELHEPEVFEGMSQTINTHKPIVIFEVLLPEIADKLNLYFQSVPYRLFHLQKDDSGFLLKSVEKLEGRVNFDWNYLACPEGKLEFLKTNLRVV